MTFAHPLMLWGTLAALVPLLIHLFDRRRPRPVPFGAIAFVLKSQKRTASRLKLKRLLLYALRTLFLLAIPLALARPEWHRSEAATVARGTAATAVLVDTSLALRFHEGRGVLFDEARKEARAAIAALQAEEPVALVACGPSARVVAPLSFEKARAVGLVDELQPGYGVADLNRCLDVAARALDESPLKGRRLVVVSAFTQPSLRLETPPPVVHGPQGQALKAEVLLRDVASGRTELPNVALVDARAEAAPQVGPRAWQFTFTVRNAGATAVQDAPLQLEVGGQVVAKGFVDVAGHGTAQKTLGWRFPQGGTATVKASLAPDALTEDDTRTLVVPVPKEARALVVNGAPSPQKFRDEAFFLESSLAAAGSPVRTVVRDTDAAWREDFAGFDALFLLNVPAPPADVAARLLAFVQGGGGLFVSLGDRVDADAWNATMGAVLPRRLRVVKTAVEPGAPDAQARSARLQSVAVGHAIFTPFTGRAREGLLSTRFSRYFLFETEGASPVEVLGTMDDGAPVFLASRQGKGRVLLYSSSVDADWSDLPIRTGFLPLVQRIAAWLTGSLDEREELKARVGEVLTLPVSAELTPALARTPSGVELPITTSVGAAQPSVGPLPEPGRYDVLDAAGKPLDALTFAAGLDPLASDTTRLSMDAVSAWFGEDVVAEAGAAGEGRQTPVWTWLLLVAVLAFGLEGVLLRK